MTPRSKIDEMIASRSILMQRRQCIGPARAAAAECQYSLVSFSDLESPARPYWPMLSTGRYWKFEGNITLGHLTS
jgi:hypothetical protein